MPAFGRLPCCWPHICKEDTKWCVSCMRVHAGRTGRLRQPSRSYKKRLHGMRKGCALINAHPIEPIADNAASRSGPCGWMAGHKGAMNCWLSRRMPAVHAELVPAAQRPPLGCIQIRILKIAYSIGLACSPATWPGVYRGLESQAANNNNNAFTAGVSANVQESFQKVCRDQSYRNQIHQNESMTSIGVAQIDIGTVQMRRNLMASRDENRSPCRGILRFAGSCFRPPCLQPTFGPDPRHTSG